MDKKEVVEVIINIRPSPFTVTPEDYGYEALFLAVMSDNFMSAEECNKAIRGKTYMRDTLDKEE